MRKSTFHALAFSILVGLPTASLAGSEDIVIEDAWARASIGTNRPGVAYMTLRNTGTDPVTLVGLETPLGWVPIVTTPKIVVVTIPQCRNDQEAQKTAVFLVTGLIILAIL